MMQPNVPKTQEGDFTCEHDLYDAPIFEKEAPDNLKRAAQANLDRFGFNKDRFVDRPRPNGRET